MTASSIQGTFCRLGILLMLAGMTACATPPPADDPDAVADFKATNDPFEPTNRAMFAFNDKVNDYVLHPAARGYRSAVPPFGRARVADVIANLDSPIVFANDLLQGDLTRATRTLTRFVLNTTFGVGGIMDVSTPLGLPGHEADLGETMGVWGIGEGPYIVLPLFGPSDVRDAIGLGADSYADPLSIYLGDHRMHWVSYTRFGVTALSLSEHYLDTLDDMKRSSLDFYATMRSLYRQRREAQIAQKIAGSGDPPAFFVRLLPRFQTNF